MDKNTRSHQYFANLMEGIYPASPLPSDEQFKICINFLDGESFALPVIEFCHYAHARKINWIACSWKRDLLPLKYDTTILPSYIFSTTFLRYYFPSCLKLTVEYFWVIIMKTTSGISTLLYNIPLTVSLIITMH